MKAFLPSLFRITILAMFIAICFSGCVIVARPDYHAVKPKGGREIYEFKVGEYNRIKAEGNFEIRYQAAFSDTVTLAVQPNLRDYFTVEVADGELVAVSTRRINFGHGRGPVLTVSTPTLNRIVFEGAGTFTANDKITSDSLVIIIRGAAIGKAELDVDNLSAEISGAGRIVLSGKADTAALNLSGVGELNALSLEARDATVNLSGTGTVRVNSSDNLHINASGTGSVEYRGSPGVNLNTGGLVGVRQLN